MQSFLGIFNNYKRFIRSCFAKANHLTKLTKNASFQQSPSDGKYGYAKKILALLPLLTKYNRHVGVSVTTDAFAYAVGSVHDKEQQEEEIIGQICPRSVQSMKMQLSSVQTQNPCNH